MRAAEAAAFLGGAAPGNHTSPTQAFSALNFDPPTLHERDMWGTNPFDHLWCRMKFKSLRYDGMFTPPSDQGSLVFPGNFGVFDWGGVAVDPVRQVLIANPSYMAFTSKRIPRAQIPTGSGKKGSETSGITQALGTPFGFELNVFLSRRSAFLVRLRRGAISPRSICVRGTSCGSIRTAPFATARRCRFQCRWACRLSAGS
jgi:glucose dehydrogenase